MGPGRDSSNFLEGRRLDNGPNVRRVEASMEPSRFSRLLNALQADPSVGQANRTPEVSERLDSVSEVTRS